MSTPGIHTAAATTPILLGGVVDQPLDHDRADRRQPRGQAGRGIARPGRRRVAAGVDRGTAPAREPITPSGVDAPPPGGFDQHLTGDVDAPPVRPPPAVPGSDHVEVVAASRGRGWWRPRRRRPPRAASAMPLGVLGPQPPKRERLNEVLVPAALQQRRSGLGRRARPRRTPAPGVTSRRLRAPRGPPPPRSARVPMAPAWARACCLVSSVSWRLMPAEAGRQGSRRARGSPAARRSTSSPPGCVIRRSS